MFYKLIIVSIPLILSGILQFFYNAADLIICGMFGSNHAVAAISSTSSLTSLIIKLFLGLSVGANVLMARWNEEKGELEFSAVYIDIDNYNPESDKCLFQNYSFRDLKKAWFHNQAFFYVGYLMEFPLFLCFQQQRLRPLRS